jgi:Zn ribbon nucleic-acid-binding protein
MAASRRCVKCGSAETKVYPDEFDAAKWPLTRMSPRERLAGGPDPWRPIVVCTSCGHNEDLPAR